MLRVGFTALVVMIAGIGPAIAAGEPVAVVEDVSGTAVGVELMDYVTAGQVIHLRAGDKLVLGYMGSCWQETITGGTVTVGRDQSTVKDGKVARAKVACDGGKMQLSAAQASKSGAVVFRGAPARKSAVPQPQLVLYGLSPVVDIKGGGHISIERLDQPGERIEIDVAAHQLFRGAFYDFAKSGQALVAGGVYRARVGAQEIVFKVDPYARPGQAPIIGRLLRFRPAA